MGLPMVTTNSPGCYDVVENGVNGFLIPARDSDTPAHAILRLAEHSTMRQRFGRESRRCTVNQFDL